MKINFIKIKIYQIILFLIIILAFLLRIYGLNWDQGNHLHPDERMITMVAVDIKFPESHKIYDILSSESSLNPKFFAYGSLPIYLLKFSGYIFSNFDLNISSYDKINLLGRLISAFFDSLTVLLIYFISKEIFSSNKKALLASAIYTFSVFPIQLSHFYAVDTLLTFFISLTLYRLIILYRHFSLKNSIIVGVCFGLAMATKVSAFVLLIPIFICLVIDTIIYLQKQIYQQKNSYFNKIIKTIITLINPLFWLKSKYFNFNNFILSTILVLLFSSITFVICQPFTIIDFSTFWRQINEQSVMTKNAFIFPYTLQYVGTIPYLYQIKNIFLWGLGPSFSILSLLGVVLIFKKLIKGFSNSENIKSEAAQLILFSFFIVYFLVTGNFAVKFMRYSLPLYPIFAILSVNAFFTFRKNIKLIFLFVNLLWVISFLSIYSKPNTRVSATNWIVNNISPGSTILREHWDDGLPLGYHDDYTLEELNLYDSDLDPQKWLKINQQLDRADYIIIASNRLYTPLQKLTNCQELPADKCYSSTAKYYQNLFNGNLGYKKVAEFTSFPSFLGFTINDQSADESFTVYDHPKVVIFKNGNKNI